MEDKIEQINKEYYLAYKGFDAEDFDFARKVVAYFKKKKVDSRIFYLDESTIAIGIDVRYKNKASAMLKQACNVI